MRSDQRVTAADRRIRLPRQSAGWGSLGIPDQYDDRTTTGALTFIGTVPGAVASGLLIGLAVHPTNEFLYIADETAQVYGWDIGDGGFSGRAFAHNSTIAAVKGPVGEAIDPALQKCLYVTNTAGSDISRYAIDLKSGVLTSLGSTSTGTFPLGVTMTPKTGSILVNTDVGDGGVYAFAQSGSTCSLTLLNSVTIPGPNFGAQLDYVAFNPLTFSPSDPTAPAFNVAYVTDETHGMVHEFNVNGGGIALATSITPGGLGATPDEVSVAVHKSGAYVYTGSIMPPAISLFDVDTANDATAGQLTWVSNTAAAGLVPVSLAIEPMGKFLYSANSTSATISEFSINPVTGALTPIGTVNSETPPNPGSTPDFIVTTN